MPNEHPSVLICCKNTRQLEIAKAAFEPEMGAYYCTAGEDLNGRRFEKIIVLFSVSDFESGAMREMVTGWLDESVACRIRPGGSAFVAGSQK